MLNSLIVLFQTPALVCKLSKALYGLKQSARQWHKFLASLLKQLGFNSVSSDQSMFYNTETKVIVISDIDDLLIFDKEPLIQQFKKAISAQLEITGLGPISYYLGIEVRRTPDSIFMSQQKFTAEALTIFGKISLKTHIADGKQQNNAAGCSNVTPIL